MAFPFFGGGDVSGNAIIRMGVNASGIRGQVRSAFNDVKAEAAAGARGIEQQSRVWGAAFSALKVAAVGSFIGVATAIGIGVTAAINYESAFAGVIKTVDASKPELDALRQTFRDMAKEIPLSAVEFARLGEAAGALGVKTENIAEFARITALIGVTTDVASDQAATSLGQLSNVLDLTAADYERFGSALVDLGNKGASTESQILEIAARSGAVGHTVGLTTPQILAFAAGVANLGIEVEAGGTALQFLYQRLALLLADETGLAKLGAVAGMTGEQFKQAFLRDANQAILSLLRGLGDLDPVAQAVALDELGLAGARTSRAYIGLAESLNKNLLPAQDVANEAWAEGTALQVEASKRFATTASQIQLLKNRIGDLFITLGDSLLPAVNSLVKFLGEAIPAAAGRLADAWNTTLGPAVAVLLDGLGRLAGAFLGIFGFDSETADWGAVVGTAFDGVVFVLQQLAEWGGKVAGILATIIGNDTIQRILQFAAAWGTVRLLAGGALGALRGLASLGPRTLRFLTFGAVGGGAAAPARPGALTGAAGAAAGAGAAVGGADDQLQLAARDLRVAAKELQAAAVAQRTAGVAGAAGGRPTLTALPGGLAPGTVLGPTGAPMTGAQAAAARLAGQATATRLAQEMGAGATAATRGPGLFARLRNLNVVGGQMVTGALSQVAAGASAAMTGGRAALGLAGSALGLASKAFWPAMIGLFVAELVGAPIGGFVANSLGLKNLGAEIQGDLIGGIGTWLTSVVKGVDVEKIANLAVDEVTVGGVTITAVDAAKAGMTRAQIETIFVEDMTLTGTVLAVRAARTELRTEDLPELTVPRNLPIPTPPDIGLTPSRGAGIVGTPEYRDFVATLQENAKQFGVDWQDALADAAATGLGGTVFDRATLEFIAARIRAAATGSIRDSFAILRQAVGDDLRETFGLTAAGAAALTDADIERLAILIEHNVDGSLDATIGAIIASAQARIEGYTPPEPGTARPVTPRGGAPEFADLAPPDILQPFKAQVVQAQETYADFLQFLKESPQGADLAAAGQALIDGFGSAIRAADSDEERQALVDKLLPPQFHDPAMLETAWAKLLADYQAAIESTGQDKLAGLAQAYAAMQTAAVAEGRDFAKTETGAQVRQALIDAWNDEGTSPEVKAAIAAALRIGVDSPEARGGVQEGVESSVGAGVTAGARRVHPKASEEGRRLMREVGHGASRYGLGPELDAAVRTALNIAFSATVTTSMVAKGRLLMQWLAQGISQSAAVTLAITGRLNEFKAMLPGSPVRMGPLKDPFLPNAGKQIIEQITGGMPGLTMPGLDIGRFSAAAAPAATAGPRGEGGGRVQHISIDRFYGRTDRDEQSAVARLAFLMPEG